MEEPEDVSARSGSPKPSKTSVLKGWIPVPAPQQNSCGCPKPSMLVESCAGLCITSQRRLNAGARCKEGKCTIESDMLQGIPGVAPRDPALRLCA